MKVYGYSTTKPARIVGKMWSEGLKNLRKSYPEAFPLQPDFTMVPSVQAGLEKAKEPEAKIVLCQPVAPRKRLAAYMPDSPVPPEAGWAEALNLGEEPLIRLPNLASFALPTPAGYKESFRAQEHKGKGRRIAVFLSPLRFTAEQGQQRFMSYHDFVKWELSSYLDDHVEKHNVHLLSWADNPDSEFDAQDIQLRIRRSYSTYLQPIERYDEVASMLSNVHQFITDDRNLALMARGLGRRVVFLSDSYASDDPDAALLGPGYFEPYTFCAETLRRRVVELNDWKPDAEMIEANKMAAAALFTGTNKIFVC